MDPLVSIPILCHDYGRFLPEAIESALAQSYARVEVVVWDDGSTDDTPEAAARYPEVELVRQENAGLVRTCNRAVTAARGEWFCFLSADDCFAPTYVEELLESVLASEGASFAYCDASLFGAQSGVQRSLAFDPVTLARVNFVNGCALTRRADYIAIGGYDQELETVGFEDWDFWLRMVGNGRRGAYLPKPLLHWRRHETGSRNPTTDPEVARAAAIVRKRNAGVVERLSSVRRSRLARRLAVHPRVVRTPFARRAVERRLWRAITSRG
jgi:glycosyltransferase involved in cell wall biosynthesis